MAAFGIIPARGGSKGLPGKNLRPLGGIPLIGWTIRAAAESRELARTYFSTDDAEIARTARDLGAEVPFLRPAELATDDASILDVVQHALEELLSRTGEKPDIVVLLQPTTPFRSGRHIDETVRLLRETGADSVQTVAQDLMHPHHRFTLWEGRLTPLLPPEKSPSRRQEAEPVFRPNGGVYAARTELILEKNALKGTHHRGVIMDFESSVDIDTLWDFKLAELMLEERALR